MTIEVRHEDGYHSVYVDGQRLVDRESFIVAHNIAACLRDPLVDIGTESREVADAILAWKARQ